MPKIGKAAGTPAKVQSGLKYVKASQCAMKITMPFFIRWGEEAACCAESKTQER